MPANLNLASCFIYGHRLSIIKAFNFYVRAILECNLSFFNVVAFYMGPSVFMCLNLFKRSLTTDILALFRKVNFN